MEITILPKGQSIDIKAKVPSLTKLAVGLGWDVSSDGGADFDLDATAILLDSAGKAQKVVYYSDQEYTVNGTDVVKYMGDNLTGQGDGDDEVIKVELDKVPAEIAKIAILVNIYEAKSRGQDFSKVNSSFVRLVDDATNTEFARHDLQKEYAGKSGVIVGEFYREGGNWQFKAVAEGVDGSIKEIMSAKGY